MIKHYCWVIDRSRRSPYGQRCVAASETIAPGHATLSCWFTPAVFLVVRSVSKLEFEPLDFF